MKRGIKYLFILVAMWPSGFLSGQSILWDSTYTEGFFSEIIYDMALTSNGDILAVGAAGGPPYFRKILKFDSLGTLKWIRDIPIDTASSTLIGSIIKVHGEDNFYIGGYSKELGVFNYDFVAKIDSSADTIWVKRYSYPSFYQSTLGMTQLQDKSVVMTGDIQTSFGFDVIARRIDSMGNTLWERIYNAPGEQAGRDMTEMLDGSLIIAGSSDGDNLLMRIGFDGRLIDDTIFTALESGMLVTSGNKVSPFNQLIGNNFLLSGSTPKGNAYIINNPIFLANNWVIGPNVENLTLNQDSFTFYREFIFGFRTGLYKVDYMNQKLDSLTFAIDNTIRDIVSILRDGENLIVAGAKGTSSNRDYWVASVDGLNDQWIPDHCAYQPPVAGFEYEYNYPILTLRDTSTGGLKYLDTVYTWEWTTSVGQGGNMDSAQIFFDTAITKTIDVQLVISNWYGCADTVSKTLNFDPNSIREEKPLDVKVYPNPVSDVLHIEFTEEVEGDILFEIFDLHGTKLKSETFTGPSLRSTVHHLPSGMYFYTISSGNQIRRGKLIKQ